ncbi:MAG TPA: hypothetical protein VMM12_05915 [Longimicrobiales bacterium]|nr:hypothetical protein [Longimicrobiales bacterium]
MSWEPWHAKDGLYYVDWAVVGRLIRSHELAVQKLKNWKTVRTSQSSWYNPFSWSMPDIEQVEIDWDHLSDLVNVNTFAAIQASMNRGEQNMANEARRLQSLVLETAHMKEQFLRRMRDLQRDNSRRIEESVDSYQTQIDVAKFTRDTSAGTLMVGATVLSGGTATAVIAAGSGLKGVAKFQDTGSAGAATIEAAGSFVFAIIPLKAKAGGNPLSGVEEGCLVVLEAVTESATGLVEGKTVKEALATGALKFTDPVADKLFASDQVKKLLGRVSIPVDVQVFITGEAAMLAKAQVSKHGGALASAHFGRSAPPRSRPNATAAAGRKAPGGHGAIANNVMLDGETLLHTAVISDRKGLGNGW